MYYPIKLDKVRNLKYGMRAINLVEKTFNKKFMEIEGIGTGMLSMEEYATIVWAGLMHEDKELTPELVMDLIDKHSSIREVSQTMWKAVNEVFAADDEDQEGTEKNE